MDISKKEQNMTKKKNKKLIPDYYIYRLIFIFIHLFISTCIE